MSDLEDKDVNDIANLLHTIQQVVPASASGIRTISYSSTSDESTASSDTISVESVDHQPDYVISSSNQKNLQRKVIDAIRCGHLSILEKIHTELPNFSFNFSHTFRTSAAMRPLQYACKCSQKDVIKWLLTSVADLERECLTKDNETVLILAVNHSSPSIVYEVVQCLLKDGGQNLGSKEKHKMTALHIACAKGYIDVMTLLLDYNNAWLAQGKKFPKTLKEANLRNMDGNTPLMLAISGGHLDIVEKWLQMEKDPSCLVTCSCADDLNKKGLNAILYAVLNGKFDCLKLMERYGVITDEELTWVTKKNWNVIHCAVASGNLEMLKWLLTEKPIILEKKTMFNDPDTNLYTPFLLACEYYHDKNKLAEYLITLPSAQKGITIDLAAKTKDGKTALHFAAMKDAGYLAGLLLDKQVIDPMSIEQKYGNTALHTATSKSSWTVENKLKENLSTEKFQELAGIRNNNRKTAEEIRAAVYVPQEISKRGKKSIEAYKKALREGKTKNNNCNLVVLGEQRVGKTSLIRGIMGKEFDPNSKPTQGVQLDQIRTLAECVSIEMLGQDTWEPVIDPMKRISDKHSDIVASAVSEANPKPITNIDEHMNTQLDEKDLLKEVKDIIQTIKTQHQRELSTSIQIQHGTARSVTTQSKPYQSPPSVNCNPSFQHKPSHASIKIIDPSTNKEVKVESTIRPPKVFPVSAVNPTSKHIRHVRKIEPDVTFASLPRSDIMDIARKVKLKKRPMVKEGNLIFHAIDFAGQALYRPMHHCFITHRAVYFVVFKLTDLMKHIRGGEIENDPIKELRYWLNNIIAHSKVTKQDEDPKIFLIGTHKNGDQSQVALTENEINEIDQKLKEVFLNIEEKRYDKVFQFESDEGGKIVFPLENSHTTKADQRRSESGILKLMKRIEEIKADITFLSNDFPTSYMRFELKLLEMQKKRGQQPLVTKRKEVEMWAQDCGIDEQGINTAIQFYHDIRLIVDQGLVQSPFHAETEPISCDDNLVLLSPQWLGDMMCKIVNLQLGNKKFEINRLKSFAHTGVMLKSDLQLCLLGKCELQPAEKEAFDNLLKILKCYCLILQLTKPLYKLLHLDCAPQDLFLIPCKMKSKPIAHFPKECYKFEFDFESYLPKEVYVHCVCKFLSKIAETEPLPEDEGRMKVDLSESRSVFFWFKLKNDLPLADWMIEMDETRHVLRFSVHPCDDQDSDTPSQYIINLNELIIDDVCSNGSLGCLAYNGGPSLQCCSDNDNDCVILPFIRFDPDNDFPSPDSPLCKCLKCYKQFNIDDILKQQVAEKQHQAPATAPVVQNIQNVMIGTNSETTLHTGSQSGEQVTTIVPSASLPVNSQNQQNPPPHFLVVKIAEEYCKEGERFAMYMDIEWDEYGAGDEIMQKTKKLLRLIKAWIETTKATEDDLRRIAQCVDHDKAKSIL